ncbi:hypothetical protein H4Q32_014052 [Labeo rohita]|uniref:ribonuclease H n=1 Tax=Labeo rohita TaxID=84645 RepID=A0ABQ8LSU3_LABRO|nr:hypothetical protein H4Q32_014052 [Labeo rohita]
MDAALSPLRQRGICILNYLNDWLVLAQLEVELLSHRSLILSHLECLGLEVNLAKSALHPSRRISFLGAVFDSTQISHARSSSGNRAACGLIQNRCLSPPQDISEDARPYGLSIPSAKVRPASYAAPSVLAETTGSISCVASRVLVYQGGPGLCKSPDWKDSQWMERGVPLGIVCRRKVVTTDASNMGWGALYDGKPAFGLWTKAQEGIHINCLEMLAVCLEWAQLNLCSLRAAHVPGRLNQGADMLSQSNVPSGEWMLHPRTVQKIWEIFGKAEVDLFASEDNFHCPMYYSKDRDALAHDWLNLLLYAFPPTSLIPHVLKRVRNQHWFSELCQLLVAAPWPIPLKRDFLSQVNGTISYPQPKLWALHLWCLDGSLLVLGYCCNLNSLRYGNEYCVTGRAMSLHDIVVASVEVT